MSRTTVALTLALLLPAVAAAKFDADASAKTIAPFVDEHTVAVAHVDLTRIDVDGLFDKVAEATKSKAEEFAAPRRELHDWLMALTDAGGREVYVVLSLSGPPGEPPFVVVPLEEGADGNVIGRVLGRSKVFESLRFETRDRAVVGAAAGTRERLRTLKPAPRADLARAFAAAGDTTAQVLLLPTADARRVLSELMPTLPAQLGGASTQPLTQGLQWAALGVDLPPKPALRLTLQARDTAAQKLAALLLGVEEAAGKQEEVRQVLPDFEKIAALLKPEVVEDRVVISLRDKDMLTVLPSLARPVVQNATRVTVMNNLKQIDLASINYADAHGSRLPAQAISSKDGKPLLSWRVLILPYLEQGPLYQEFHLDEPWDSEHNKPLIARMPKVYQGLNWKLNREGKTNILAPIGKDLAFTGGPQGLRFPGDFPDGTANTILLVEGDDDHAVIWTKPDDLTVDLADPHKGLGGHFEGGFLVALADGSARFVRRTISKTTLRYAFVRNDGQPLGSDW